MCKGCHEIARRHNKRDVLRCHLCARSVLRVKGAHSREWLCDGHGSPGLDTRGLVAVEGRGRLVAAFVVAVVVAVAATIDQVHQIVSDVAPSHDLVDEDVVQVEAKSHRNAEAVALHCLKHGRHSACAPPSCRRIRLALCAGKGKKIKSGQRESSRDACKPSPPPLQGNAGWRVADQEPR